MLASTLQAFRSLASRSHLLNVPIAVSLLTLVACGEQSPSRSPHNLELRTAPLNLEGIDFACYDILVVNGDEDPVVALGDPATTLLSATPDAKTICSTQYGNGPGGAITYIAPCDASEPAHTVTLWVDGLYTGTPATPAAVPFQDPCPNGCTLPAICAPNADTPVEFNITIMRPANQGFFDIAVNFDNIFCSAKLDCEYAPDEPIQLLHNPATGKRDQTVVLGLACTAGPGANTDTVLFRNPITISCNGADPIVLDPTLGDGSIYGPVMTDPDLTDPVWQYAIYSGAEDLDCGGLPCNKLYWNVAIGFNPNANGCTLTTTATASSGLAMPGFTTPEAATYPLIDIDVDLTGPTGGLVCSQHPLNGTPTGVRTTYTTLLDPLAFCNRFDGVSFATGDASECAAFCASPPCANGTCVSERYEFTLPESLFDQLTCELPPTQPMSGQCSRAGVPVVFFGQEFANANRTGGAVVPGEGTLGLSFGRWFDPGPASRFQVNFDFSYTRGNVLGTFPEDPFAGKTVEEKMAIIQTALEEAFPCFDVEASVSNTTQSATFKLVTDDASSCAQFDIHTLNRVGVVQSNQMGAGLWAGKTDHDCCNQLYEVTVDITPSDVRSEGLSFGYGTFLPEYFSNASYSKLFQLGLSIPASVFQALPPTPTGNEYEALVASEIAQMGDDRLSAFVNDAGSLTIRFSALEEEEFMFGREFYQLPGNYFIDTSVDQYYSHHLTKLVDYTVGECNAGTPVDP